MPKENQIRTLTTHVYGPYYDYLLFKNTFPPDGTTLEIKDLQMYTKDREVGFDKTEFVGAPPERSLGAGNEKVVFFGIMTIASLDWLSERGSECLQQDLREHDETKHLQHNHSGLTLQALYGDRTWKGSHLRVMIAGNKTLPAHFLTSRNDPDKLIMYSNHEGKRRRYWVQTLHVTTFSLSRNFFDRYRLRALIDELITTDPENTPVEKRNIDWLIQRYLAHIHPKDAHRRIITDPELEKDIYSEPRHLNHLPRARIRHFFAAQAEWLLAHMLASRSKQVKLLNIKQWIRFCHEARLDAIEAKKHGIRWGVSHGSTVDAKRSYDLSRNLAKFGHTPVFWKRRLEIVTEKKEKTSKAPSRVLSPEAHGPSPQTAQFQYDSDFSEPSTPGEPDSGADEKPNVATVPDFYLETPSIPHGRMAWTCPRPGCDFKLDLVDISHVVRDLPQFRLGDQVPPGNDWDIRTALLILISRHYESHLKRANVEVVRLSPTTWRAKPVQDRKTERRETVEVKQEELNSDVEPQVRRSSRKPRPRKQFEV